MFQFKRHRGVFLSIHSTVREERGWGRETQISLFFFLSVLSSS